MSELTPEVKAALDAWRAWRKKFPASSHGPSEILADAFAALCPDELEPGYYWCEFRGDSAVLVVRNHDFDSGSFRFAVSSLMYSAYGESIPAGVTNIRRIDDCAKWREWATRKRNDPVHGRLSIAEILECHGWGVAAIELESLLKGTP